MPRGVTHVGDRCDRRGGTALARARGSDRSCRPTATRATALMPGRMRGSARVSSSTISKPRLGGHPLLMSSLGNGADRHEACRQFDVADGVDAHRWPSWPTDSRLRSTSSTTAVMRADDRSGNSAICAPAHAASPTWNGRSPWPNWPARQLSSTTITPSVGARMTSACSPRDVRPTSASARSSLPSRPPTVAWSRRCGRSTARCRSRELLFLVRQRQACLLFVEARLQLAGRDVELGPFDIELRGDAPGRELLQLEPALGIGLGDLGLRGAQVRVLFVESLRSEVASKAITTSPLRDLGAIGGQFQDAQFAGIGRRGRAPANGAP